MVFPDPFSNDQPPRRGESRKGAASKPLQAQFLNSIESIEGSQPTLDTLSSLLCHAGVLVPEVRLPDLWKWITKSDPAAESASFGADRDLATLSKQLGARVTLKREGYHDQRVRSLFIEPTSGDCSGLSFIFSRRDGVGSFHPDEAFIVRIKSMSRNPEERGEAWRSLLAAIGISSQGQIEHRGGGERSSARPAARFGVDTVEFRVEQGAREHPLVEAVVLEGSPLDDLQFLLELGRDTELDEVGTSVDAAREWWARWLVGMPHGEGRPAVEIPSDREILSASLRTRSVVGLLRIASGESVTYGLQLELLRHPLTHLNVLVRNPGVDVDRPAYLSLPDWEVDQGKTIRLWPVNSLPAPDQNALMERIIRAISPGDPSLSPGEPIETVSYRGTSPTILAREVQIAFRRAHRS